MTSLVNFFNNFSHRMHFLSANKLLNKRNEALDSLKQSHNQHKNEKIILMHNDDQAEDPLSKFSSTAIIRCGCC